MTGSSALQEKFTQDAEQFTAAIQETLKRMRQDPGQIDQIHELFRYVHSIKSEASYLQYSEITSISHNLESMLEKVRKGEDPADLDFLNAFEEDFKGLQRLLLSSEKISEQESTPAVSSYPEIDDPGFSPGFNQFEKMLINEAKTRGDRFYCVQCEIAESAPLKQPRVFLLVNNLELIANVIRVDPPVYTKDDSKFQYITIYLTAQIEEASIYEAINIDEIIGKRVILADFETFLGERSNGKKREKRALKMPIGFRIESNKLDEIFGYLEELRIRLQTLKSEMKDFGQKPISDNLEVVKSLSDGLYSSFRSIKTQTLAGEFAKLTSLVHDLARNLGKKVAMECEGEDIELDRRILDGISDPLFHIVRNAVDHGIESVDERRASGKDDQGHVTIKAKLENENVVIVIADDGRGISFEDAKAKAQELDIQQQSDETLLSLLSRPGFTTKSQATDLSGRGVGLDLVLQRLHAFSGTVDLSSEEGRGTTVSVSVPRGATSFTIMIYRLGKTLYAVSRRLIGDIAAITEVKFKRASSGAIWANSSPVLSPNAESVTKQYLMGHKYAIFLQHLGKKGCLLADELLFDKDMAQEPAEELILGAARCKYINSSILE